MKCLRSKKRMNAADSTTQYRSQNIVHMKPSCFLISVQGSRLLYAIVDVERTKTRSHWATVVSDYYTRRKIVSCIRKKRSVAGHSISQRFASEHQR